jgi:hypothetical protein
VAVGFLLIVVVLAIAVPIVVLRGVPSQAIAARGRQLVDDVPAVPEAAALLERWRDRAIRWRGLLASSVVVSSLVASVVLRGSLDVGVGGHPAWADPLLMGLLSVFVAAIAAELHHLRPRGEGRRTVELAPRELPAYLPAGARRRSVLLVALALIASILTAVLPLERDA